MRSSFSFTEILAMAWIECGLSWRWSDWSQALSTFVRELDCKSIKHRISSNVVSIVCWRVKGTTEGRNEVADWEYILRRKELATKIKKVKRKRVKETVVHSELKVEHPLISPFPLSPLPSARLWFLLRAMYSESIDHHWKLHPQPPEERRKARLAPRGFLIHMGTGLTRDWFTLFMGPSTFSSLLKKAKRINDVPCNEYIYAAERLGVPLFFFLLSRNMKFSLHLTLPLLLAGLPYAAPQAQITQAPDLNAATSGMYRIKNVRLSDKLTLKSHRSFSLPHLPQWTPVLESGK